MLGLKEVLRLSKLRERNILTRKMQQWSQSLKEEESLVSRARYRERKSCKECLMSWELRKKRSLRREKISKSSTRACQMITLRKATLFWRLERLKMTWKLSFTSLLMTQIQVMLRQLESQELQHRVKLSKKNLKRSKPKRKDKKRWRKRVIDLWGCRSKSKP